MRFQVTVHVLGRDREIIGETELAAPLVGRVTGVFVPSALYEGVRFIFGLRTSNRAAYDDGRDLLGMRLYHEGLPRHSMEMDIVDPDWIEVTFWNVELLTGPVVHTYRELEEANVMWDCPTCGPVSAGSLDYALPGSPFAAVSEKWCPVCKKRWWLMFPAGPGWKRP